MKIGFITTIDTNIGDDFIRTGIKNIIDSVKGDTKIEYTYVNKHLPEMAIMRHSPIHLINKLPRYKVRGLFKRIYNNYFYHLYSVFRDQNLIIQSGAPVLWPDCYNNEWAAPIWYNTVRKLKDKIPVIDLAAGSCYPWERQEGFTNKKEAQYAKDIGGFCKVTTTRDKLANQLFTSVGVANALLPCTAFFVDNQFENNTKGEYILINYMEGSGHFDWNQGIKKEDWEKTIINLIDKLKENHDVRFICHSKEEVNLVEKIKPGSKFFYPKTVKEYLDVIRHAKIGINNRMHASVAMASVGVPSVSVCTDTRLLMLENIGLPIFYVKDVKVENVLELTNKLIQNFDSERKRLFALKKTKFKEYQQVLSPFFS